MKDNIAHPLKHESGIDLRKLLQILLIEKKFILISTLAFMILGVSYQSQKEKIYEASALIEIGTFIDEKNNKRVIESSNEVVEHLTGTFQKLPAFKKDKSNAVYYFKSLGNCGAKYITCAFNFVEVKSHDLSSKEASNNVSKVLEYVVNRHREKLELHQRNALFIYDKTKLRSNFYDAETEAMEKRISELKSRLSDLRYQKTKIDKNLFENKIKSSYSSLEIDALIFSQELQLSIMEFERDESILINQIESLLENDNYEFQLNNVIETKIYEQIKTNDNPISMKLSYFVVLIFIAGLFVSIFFALIKNLFINKQ